MDIYEYISCHLDKYDFDIRKSGYARFSDQKCTPDIVSFVADCIVNISPEGRCRQTVPIRASARRHLRRC